MQQYRALLKDNVSRPKPRHQILNDLESFIYNWKEENEDSIVILIMDVNADSTDPHLHTLLTNTSLQDVFQHHAPYLENQSTYINGKKRIDYILVSEDLLAFSEGAGHTSYDIPFISDHRGVYWDIPHNALFNT